MECKNNFYGCDIGGKLLYLQVMIDFQTEGVEFPMIDTAKVGCWLNEVARAHDKRVGNLTYLFCDDAYILQQNVKFLGHDYYTDVITFDYSHGDKVAGDVMISLDTVASNAEMLGVSAEKELLRVIVHGLLHLCGINDKGPGEREIMERSEDEALAMYIDI